MRTNRHPLNVICRAAASTTTGEEVTHIASLVVQLIPERCTSVSDYIESFADLSLHKGDRSDKLVVVIETSSESTIKDRISQLLQFDGVITVNMSYHHCESTESLNEVLVR